MIATNATNINPLNLRLDTRWIVVGLFLLTILTRLPFQSQYLYHWDSVNMAYGIVEFNVREGAPQYPGYIVYIALAQVVNSVIGDHQTTMLIISIVTSALAVVTMYFLGRDMFNATTGLIAALYVLSSPLVWFYGEIALPHAMDLFSITLSVWLLYRIMQGDERWLWFTAVFLALVGGFRQQDLLFLGPLILFAIYRIGLKKIILFALVGFVTTLAWFIPMLVSSNGLEAYLAGSSDFTRRFWDTTSLLHGAGMPGLRRNLINKLIPYTAYAWSLAALPALYWVPRVFREWRAGLTNRKFWFFVLWVVPTLAFYIIIHMGQQGLVFVFLPALLLLSAEGTYQLFRTRSAVLQIVTLAIVLFNAAVFILMPEYPFGADGPKLLTYNTLQVNDQLLDRQINSVRENFDPADTLILANNWRHMEYYLPEYPLARINIGSKWESDAGQVIGADFAGDPITGAALGFDPDAAWQVVVVDRELEALSTTPLQTLTTPEGYTLSYLALDGNEAFLNTGVNFGVQRTTADAG